MQGNEFYHQPVNLEKHPTVSDVVPAPANTFISAW